MYFEKIGRMILPVLVFSHLAACANEAPAPRRNLNLPIPPKRTILDNVTNLPSNASKDDLVENLPTILRDINQSRRNELPYVQMSFRVLREQTNIVSAINHYYQALPKRRYEDRLLAVKVLGALGRNDALPVLRSIVEKPLSPRSKLSESTDRDDPYERVIRRRAVRGIAFLQTAHADQTILQIIASYRSEEIRKEALWAYLWNKGYSNKAVASVSKVLATGMLKWIDLPRFYRGMDPIAFDKNVRKWRQTWAVVLDPDSPLRKDDQPRPRAGAQANCNQDVLASDSDLFAIASQVDGFREWFAHETVFNLPEDDWSGDWGFKQKDDPNVIFPFNKMLASSFLLTYGLEPQVLASMEADSSLGFWISQNVTENINDPLWDMFPGISVVTGEDGVIHVFGMRVLPTGHNLLHFSRASDGGWSVENLSQIAPLAGAETGFWGPAAYIETNAAIHVFVTLGSKQLLHYYRPPGGSWAAENVTQNRLGGSLPFAGAPFVVRAPFSDDGTISSMQPRLHVFGLDRSYMTHTDPGRLVHYSLSTNGSWSAATVLPNSSPGIEDVVGVTKFFYDSFYVIAKNFEPGFTAFKWQPGGWIATSLQGADTHFPYAFQRYWNYRIVGPGMGRNGIVLWSKRYGPYENWSAEMLFTDRKFWVVRATETYNSATAYPRLHLFATNLNAELIHLWRDSETSQWVENNLSQLFGHRMWVPEVVVGPENTIHVFGQAGEFLIHYYWSEGRGWRGDNFGNRGRINSGPVIVTPAGDEQHVLAINDDWDLMHFSQLQEPRSLPWHPNDYYALQARGGEGYKYVPRETVPEGVAASQVGLLATNQVEMACLAFENHPDKVGVTGATNRAAVMVHESVHQRHSGAFGIGMPHDAEGDDWFAHGIYWGQHWCCLHSAIQLQVEYLSDVGEFANYWVPFSVYGAACDEANILMEAKIKRDQDPGWRCGDLRPFP